ncbi:MAG: proline--tRNA ligase [Legionellaceae bacterium]|nr:proline--tRNA ligase [Legionellaceae bacterium]
MRTSQCFIPTLKETPNDAEIISHQLMLRAGLIRKLGSGLYTWLPLGMRILHKVETIVREEMSKIQALEVLMPAVQPAELWQETGRWDSFGGQLLKMQDNSGRAYCYGPTHEEVITDLMRYDLKSYKQLPLNLYQIQTKFRDEIRPRFGVMRAREFIMKDAYSFNMDQASLQHSYDQMYQAYCRIFDRMGLAYRAVEADTGAIGGNASHEFQVLADSGEDIIFYSDQSDYAANVEKATCLLPPPAAASSEAPLQLVDTPNVKTMQELQECLDCPLADTVKTLIVTGRTDPLVALVLRGDDELNEIKAAKHPLVASPLQFADDKRITETLQSAVGSIGPVGLEIPIIADHFAAALPAFVCGANQAEKHYRHAAWGRDAHYHHCWDLRNVKDGDPSPDGKGILKTCRGIEVGHVFQLGDKYAKAMQLQVLNEQGQLHTPLMGCYGLGITRVVAAAIEQHHDDKGIIWPEALAPYQLVIIPINAQRSEAVRHFCETLYADCLNMGIDVLLDDRHERPGVLFADHDLFGIPHRIIVGERSLQSQQVEYKHRRASENEILPIATLADKLQSLAHPRH